MNTVLAVVAGFMSALLCLIVLAAAGAVGLIELFVFVGPAFAVGYWLTRRRLGVPPCLDASRVEAHNVRSGRA